MEFGNFQNKEFLTMFVVLCIALAVLLFLFISQLIFNFGDNNFSRKIKSQAFTTRVYIIDVKRNRVVYFNKSDLRFKHTIDMDGFYERFSPKDIDKVKQWIFNICLDYRNSDHYLEVDVLTDKGNNSYFSLLKLLKYNAVEGIIHCESHILKYISPELAQKKTKGIPTGVVKRSTMHDLISKEKSTKGYTYAIRFFYKKQLVLANEKIERYMIMTLKNVIYPFATNNNYQRQLVDEGDNQIFLFDMKIDNDDSALRLAQSIAKELKISIGVNGYSNSVSFSIGIVANSLYYQDFESIIAKAQESCMSGQHNSQEIVVYKKEITTIDDSEKYRSEVDKILKPYALRYLFRPIIDSRKHSILGYFSYIKAYDTPFANYNEMAKYAAMFGKNADLIATICKYIIPKFSSEAENKNWKLFIRVSFVDIENIVPTILQIPEYKKVKLVLTFDEQEINENASDLELLNTSLLKIKEHGFKIAMLMKDKNLLLDTSVYGNFDYFIAGSSMIGEIKVNNRSRLSIHTLIEQLLKYNKPIIATDLESWQSIELIIKSGIQIISTEVISPSNDMLLPVERKRMDKLKEMDEKYN